MRLGRRVVLVVAVISGVILGSAPTGAQTTEVVEVRGSAFGGFVDLTVVGGPAIDFGPEPFVELTPDAGNSPQADTLLSLNLSGIIVADTLNAETSGALGPDGFVDSAASVEDIFAGLPDVIVFLTADLIESSCSADAGGVTGTANLVEATALDGTIPLPVSPAPNTVIPIPALGATLTLNRQVQNADGSLEVTALALEIDFQGVTGTVEAAQSVCGVLTETTPAEPGPVAAEPVFTG